MTKNDKATEASLRIQTRSEELHVDADSEIPCVCVSTFVTSAISDLLGLKPMPRHIAAEIQTHVGPDDLNPWNLPVTDDPNRRGVLLEDAKRLIPELLRSYSTRLSFVHIGFSEIPYAQYFELADILSRRRCIVGIGFDRCELFNEPPPAPHVAKIISLGELGVVLDNDGGRGDPRTFMVAYEALESAVLKINDGFWVIGRTEDTRWSLIDLNRR